MIRRFILFALILLMIIITACSGQNSDNTTRDLPTVFVLPTPGDSLPRLRGLLDFWEAAQGELTPQQAEIWRFVAQPEDEIMLRVIGRGNIEATMRLEDDNGNVLGTGAQIEATLEGGSYSVLVSLLTGDMTSTDITRYEIGLSYLNRPNPFENPTLIPEVVGVPTPIPVCGELEALSYVNRLVDEETLGAELRGDIAGHLYIFEGTAGQYIQVEMNRVSGGIDPVLTLYDPTCSALAIDDDSQEPGAILRNILLPEDGLYSVRASSARTSGDTSGAYSIRLLAYERFSPVTPTFVAPPTLTPIPTYLGVTPGPAAPDNRLEDHIPVQGIISDAGSVARYPFYAASGEVVTIGVSPAEGSGLRPEFEVVDPDGVIIGRAQAITSNASGDALLPELRTAMEGTHSIFVRGESSTTGPYTVSYGLGTTRLDTYKGPLDFGVAVEAAIQRKASRDIYSLHLSPGDIITVSATPPIGSGLDPVLELVRADAPNTIIAENDNSGGNLTPLLERVQITESGLYLLRVRPAQNTTGAYSIIWRYVNIAPTPTVPPAVAPVMIVNDTVEQNQYNFYPFQGRTGQRIAVRVEAEPGSSLDPVAALIGPDGFVLQEADDSEDDLNPRFTYTLPADGTYAIRVNGYLSEGDFRVTVEELFRIQATSGG